MYSVDKQALRLLRCSLWRRVSREKMDSSNRAADDSHLGRRQARLIFVLAIVFPTLGTLALAARLYSSHVIKKSYGWDDWAVIGSLVGAVGLLVNIGLYVLGLSLRSMYWCLHRSVWFGCSLILPWSHISGIFVGRFGYHVGDLVTRRELVIDAEVS